MIDLLERSDLATVLLQAAMKAAERSETIGLSEPSDQWEAMRDELLTMAVQTEEDDRKEPIE